MEITISHDLKDQAIKVYQCEKKKNYASIKKSF